VNVAALSHPGRCPACKGKGQLGYASERMRLWDIQETCPCCRGRGLILVRFAS
jgi:DnaJ-class molecular chaperone